MFSDSNVNLLFILCHSCSILKIFVLLKYKKYCFSELLNLQYLFLPVVRLDFVFLIKGQTCAPASPLAAFPAQNKS